MHVRDKLNMDMEGLIQNGPITIVAFGDSVTHGALRANNNYETVYWNVLKQKLNAVRDFIPVNVMTPRSEASLPKPPWPEWSVMFSLTTRIWLSSASL